MTGRPTTFGHLTPRQAQVISELARGGTTAEVAERVGIAHNTVRNLIGRALIRMGATSNVHLLALAITAGDVDPDVADGTALGPAERRARVRRVYGRGDPP